MVKRRAPRNYTWCGGLSSKLLRKAEKILREKKTYVALRDIEQLAKKVCPPNDEKCIREWIKKHGKGIDILGIDTPGSKIGIELERKEKEKLGRIVSRIWKKKTRKARLKDLRKQAIEVYPPSSLRGLRRWIRKHGKGVDIEGLDTPSVKSFIKARGRRPRGLSLSILSKADLDTILWRLETSGASLVKENKILRVEKTKLGELIDRQEDVFLRMIKYIDQFNNIDKRPLYFKINFSALRNFYDLKDNYLKLIANWDPDTRQWLFNEGKAVAKIVRGGIDITSFLDGLKKYIEEGGLEVYTIDENGRLVKQDTNDAVRLLEERLRGLNLREAMLKELPLLGVYPRYRNGEIVGVYPTRKTYAFVPERVIEDAISLEGFIKHTTLFLKKYDRRTGRFVEEKRPLFIPRIIEANETLNMGGVSIKGKIVPRGLLKYLVREAEKRGNKVYVTPYAPWVVELYDIVSPVKLREYQAEAVASALKDMALYGGSIIQASTGSGKTEMAVDIVARLLKYGKEGVERFLEKIKKNYGEDAYRYYKELYKSWLESGKPRIFFLSLSTDLLRQFKARAKKYGLEVGLVTADEFDVNKPIVAVTVQSLYKALEKVEGLTESEKTEALELPEDVRLDEYDVRDPKKLVNLFKKAMLVVFDEVQHVPARTVKRVVRASETSLKLGLSATPYRDDGRDLEIYGFMGPVADRKVTSSELASLGYLVPAVILMVHYTDRKIEDADRELRWGRGNRYQKVKKAVFYNYERNKWIAEISEKLKELGFAPGLILVKEIKHGKLVADALKKKGLKVVFVSGEMKPKDREKYFDMIRKGELDYIVATTLADEGLDLPPLRSLFIVASTKSKTRALQRVGRVVRIWPGKKIGLVIDVADNILYMDDHARVREKIYETEKAWKIIHVDKNNLPRELEKIKKEYYG